jgi:hypothetical protein
MDLIDADELRWLGRLRRVNASGLPRPLAPHGRSSFNAFTFDNYIFVFFDIATNIT